MKILVVQESDWIERGPHQQHHLMERLRLRGHEVRVIDYEIGWRRRPRNEFCSKRKVFNRVSKEHKLAGVTVIRPGILKLPIIDYVSLIFTHGAEIRRQIIEFNPDVIVALGVLNAFISMVIARRHKIPFIYYLIDVLHTLIPIKQLRFTGKALEKNTLKECDVVCVINEELKRYSIEMGAQPDRIHVVRAGIDAERFSMDVDGCALRERLGISRDDVVLFFMGWLYQFSGLREVALELAKVDVEGQNIKLLIVGKGDLFHELQRIKKDLGLKQLILTGWQPYEKIPEYIAAADICLLPAQPNEVMKNIVPIKMYEYMASGKPVIATRLPGLVKEFGYDNGVIYVNQPSEVLKKVIELCHSNSKLTEYGARARSFVGKNSWDKITDEFEDILSNAALSS